VAHEVIAMTRLLCVIASALIATLPLATSAQAPAYPSKPIRLIVPFPPGAGTDSVARLVAQKLGDALGTSVVADNRTGAGGAIGAAEAARAAPDGYTLLFVAGPFTTVAAASRSPGYDPIRQFTPVAPIAAGPLAFVINADVPAGTMREFIALAKAKPGTLNYGSAGTGSINHLALELLKLRTGVDIVHVPYKGIAPATQDLLAGQIQAITASIPATLPQLAQGRVKVIAVTGPKRVALMPGVPSWQEEGVADASVINYWGIVAPAGTPPEIVARLNAEIQKLLTQPEVRARLDAEGAEIIAGPPDRLGALIQSDLDRWKKLIADAKLQLD
jgi:tripartite-type tricarboxylate transporter receptor subunit TctC